MRRGLLKMQKHGNFSGFNLLKVNGELGKAKIGVARFGSEDFV